MRERSDFQELLDEGIVNRVRRALEHEADGRDIDLGSGNKGLQRDDCDFCRLEPRNCVALHASPCTVTILDRTPVTRGHSLVIIRRHAPNLESLTEAELAELFAQARLVAQVLVQEVYMVRRGLNAEQHSPADAATTGVSEGAVVNRVPSVSVQNRFGYNIGVNNGQCAGQSVPHVHVHVIPRAPGDGFWCTHRPWGMELAKRRLKANRHRL
ncbi:hypothetical protein CCYA_CCYA18G4524 [Cyanidiococcus yangmingshanensis]|nr:hypothetical protein CCYA_CCYA18G4524 [Cyanidiococcus yangmingshanensis]